MSSRFMLAGLKEARERLNLSQCETAQRCGVSSSAYHRWESGETNPSADKTEEVSEALGCTVEQLMFGFRPDAAADGPQTAPEMVTREEFDELRAKVDRLLERPVERKPSIYHDASEIAKRLGVVDEHGYPVEVGCSLTDGPYGIRSRKVVAIEIAEPKSMPGSGLASVTCVMDDGARLSAVDMRVKGFVVCGKRAER